MAVAKWHILTPGETSPEAQDALAQQVTRMQQNKAQLMRKADTGAGTRQIVRIGSRRPGPQRTVTTTAPAGKEQVGGALGI